MPTIKNERVSLTDERIRKLEKSTERRFVYDAKVPGLFVCIMPTGSKTFGLYKRVHGKPSRVMLGKCPPMTVAMARDAATNATAEITNGGDPQARRRSAREGMTLGAAWESFKARAEAKSRGGTIRTNKSRFDTCLKAWENRRLMAISRGDVVKLHHSLGKKHGNVSANRAIQLLRALFNHANRDCGQAVVNPAAAIELFREHSRERFLKADELPRFFQALAKVPDETIRDFIAVALWTGQRRGNVQSMRWADVDMVAATWTIPAESFKTHKALTVPLAAPALEILQRRWRDRTNHDWVFPGRGKSGHLMEPKIQWERMLEAAGIEGLTLHDLRRTFGSWQVAAGSSLAIVGGSLGHSRPETTAIYGRLQLDTIRDSVNRATAAIEAAGRKSN